MNIFKLTILCVISLALCLTSAFADEISHRQKLFDIQLAINPNANLDVKSVNGKMGVYLLTNNAGEIIAMQAGGGNSSGLTIVSNKGTNKIPFPEYVVCRDLASQTRYRLVFDGEIIPKVVSYSDFEVFYLDATQVDPKRGGKIQLRFPTSFVADEKAKIELSLENVGGRWIALVREGAFGQRKKIVDTVTIKESFSGIGIASPELTALDASQVESKLRSEQLTESEKHKIETLDKGTKTYVGLLKKTMADKENKLRIQLREVNKEEADREEMANTIPR